MSNVMTTVECGHTLKFGGAAPVYWDLVFCVRCDTWKRVTGSTVEWAWRCDTCHHNQGYGIDSRSARRGAQRHASTFRHVLVLRHGDDFWTIAPELPGQTTLDIPVSERSTVDSPIHRRAYNVGRRPS